MGETAMTAASARMDSSSSSHRVLYESARQVIEGASVAAGTPDVEATGGPNTTRRPKYSLKDKLDRLVEEANHGGGTGKKKQQQATTAVRGNGDTVLAVRAHGDISSENDGNTGEERQEGGGRNDECLGLMAEAFADDLDLLRKDEHFRGSATNLAAMADMMRCLAGGLSSTEQKMLLENVSR